MMDYMESISAESSRARVFGLSWPFWHPEIRNTAGCFFPINWVKDATIIVRFSSFWSQMGIFLTLLLPVNTKFLYSFLNFLVPRLLMRANSITESFLASPKNLMWKEISLIKSNSQNPFLVARVSRFFCRS